MLFTDRAFLFVLLPFVLLLFHGAAAVGWRALLIPVLLIASIIFYAQGDLYHLPILACSILANYAAGHQLSKMQIGSRHRKAVLISAVLFNLALLSIFKYTHFVLQNMYSLLGLDWRAPSLALPIGISFYTFTQLAFLIDVYRGQMQRSTLVTYGLFATYFPHLVAGPIIHWREVIPQFERMSKRGAETARWIVSQSCLQQGILLFALGLMKKLLLADQLSPIVDSGWRSVDTVGFLDAWLISIGYTFQLYFDFSGYADMAIGISLLFGVQLPLNFDAPYGASSIQDFWHRWHITLSLWLRNYLYIPLGGNRSGVMHTYFNLFATFLLGGLWHGAAWTFVIWGALHGLACCIHKAWQATGCELSYLAGVLTTFLFVNFAWVFFRAPDLRSAGAMLKAMASPSTGVNERILVICPLLIVSAILIWCCPTSTAISLTKARNKTAYAGAAFGFALLLAFVATNTSIPSPFIYYNF
ncbi:D-alanyl-lipoteichoic acid acyltransferase DltB (MBOAT superfamily) [Tardiphaga robiniae]|uniref:MBOAT family O-acyltransferase n=1 Tax=Tardiphaga robiniae TaxID=943830 RepID=UPI002859293F|nr:MBOAT family O-acyltransferase [Tardiphaga robiniae]MDR6661323.1 D-alanyl-lipoteichoic acid acyltransferase DltB (MBOAT superfamily) [Tardiphaga robiniae]